ncbi:hypothetical protein [Streptomyces fructofermentans]|uniref:Uncharacterized protein n=1 Tax=Streptomyces fructofermentans TaxID=152141 RepID=A0A918KBC8_9ACTN|nr:hypothetical protein [Streptomyces fructofermentans]GGX57437.1 hypothetical protein GCM10010515_26280 [Streptomyces fructofermentans]
MAGVRLPQHRYSRTESTRLLCAGVYQDPSFRRRVISELVDHQERPVAPPSGIDVLPVLAHALRVTRQESRTAALMLAAWCGFLLSDVVMFWDSLSDRWGEGAEVGFGDVFTAFYQGDEKLTGGLPLPWSQFYAFVALALWFAHVMRTQSADGRRADLPDPVARAAAGAGRGVTLLAAAFALFYWYRYVSGVLDGTVQTPYPLLFPLAVALIAWWHQTAQRRALCRWLSRWTFRRATQPDLPPGPLYEDLLTAIRREQEAALTLYEPDSPFVGMGSPRDAWSFAMELRRRAAPSANGAPVPHQNEGPLTAERALTMLEGQLVRLRESAALTGKDRLREIEVDRVVYLPGGVGRTEELRIGGTADAGLPTPDGRRPVNGRPVYDPAQVAAHLAEAVDEGGEGRRVFLRVRIGAWHEQVVVTVLVRLHTQGGMLVLEVAPHVLGPVRKDFAAMDALVEKLPETWVRGALRALGNGPAIGVDTAIGALGTIARDIGTGWSDRDSVPDVPRFSLRQVAGTKGLSPYQEMDVTRYIKTIQERIVNGVRQALQEHGYQTDQFEQHVYQLGGGSVFIQDMSGGAVSTGRHGSAHAHPSAPAHGAPRTDPR